MTDFTIDNCIGCSRQFIQLERTSKSVDGVHLACIVKKDGTIECGSSSRFQFQEFAVIPDRGVEFKPGLICDDCLQKAIDQKKVEQTVTFLEGLAKLSSFDPLSDGEELDW